LFIIVAVRTYTTEPTSVKQDSTDTIEFKASILGYNQTSRVS